MPIWPTWWWPQALMQPEILSFSSPISRCRSSEAKRREMSCATGIERALASAQ
jgi:cytochrome c oxidase cbb3-type subunit 1